MNSKSILIGLTILIVFATAGLVYYAAVPHETGPGGMRALPTVSDDGRPVPENGSTTSSSQITVTSTLMQLSSSAFSANGEIPKKYTCDGEDISPPLSISEVPSEAVTLALIVDDPDAPAGDWVHWVVFNIPASTTQIAEGAVPAGAQGLTDFNRTGWGGPCPPSGTHRYFFKLYALDTELDLDSSATKAELENAMTGHILDRAQIVGLYKRG